MTHGILRTILNILRNVLETRPEKLEWHGGLGSWSPKGGDAHLGLALLVVLVKGQPLIGSVLPTNIAHRFGVRSGRGGHGL